MARWRKQFSETFPDIAKKIGGNYKSIYAAFIELKFAYPQMVKKKDTRFLADLFRFTEFCLGSKNFDFRNAAFTCFLEHLFDSIPEKNYSIISPYVSTRMINILADAGFIIPEQFQPKIITKKKT